jgi:hypothetical protein
VPGSSRAAEKESVNDKEHTTLFVSVIMACSKYVEIRVRSIVSVGGDMIGNGRESRWTGYVVTE